MRHLIVCVVCVVGAVAGAPAALAQQPLPATTVQLPTFSVFTVRTSVLVPDGGMASMAGISRGADGRVMRGVGPLANRGLGGSRAASGVSVSSRIIDHEEIDRAILAAAAGREKPAEAATAKVEAITHSIATSRPPPTSVAAIREANRVAAEREARELAELFSKAQKAEAEGQTGVAKVYYQMVARRDRGQLQAQAQQRLAALQR
jgi:hypothetical protein